ncbi:ABC transporter permease [Flavihumibacter petaseus]|uniref:Putative ABC transporter permease protein n=1 Tax=Flavihumibacter petaseus NBRC 106054 TaxID=1220578 RepID=A0A0E9MYE7_9BACT|nr:ABC transporter permease [Flavihumibacter petaseus]GAO42757.1 putative ABC transporter permease protein [Flavihumibacter petaseus NBRC 106054]
MIRSYIKTALRMLLNYKSFSAINVISLTIGMVGCFVIGLFVWDEWQFDKNIPDHANVYRIYNHWQNQNGNTSHMAPVAPAYATFLKQEYPQVEAATRILMSKDKFLMEVDNKKNYEEKGCFADSSFFKVFRLSFAAGAPATALNSPTAVVISTTLARKYFGGDNPVGKTILIDKSNFQVTGVLAELPQHFHLDFHYLMALPAAGIPKERMAAWTWTQFYTYVKLSPAANVDQLQHHFQAHIKKEIYPTLRQGNTFLPFFQPLAAVHLQSADFVYDNAIRGNETYVNALTIIAIFVLVIACFNFINLATARSIRRAKEIGVRKVIGAGRRQLIFQFLGETMLLSLLSMIIAAIATAVIIPLLNQFTGKAISFNLIHNPVLALIILLAGIITGLLAGIYPALVLSGFQPIRAFKNLSGGNGSGGVWLRQTLVVVQFALSVLLIVSTLIVYRQTRYLNNKDLGFNKEQVLYFEVRDSLVSNAGLLETFKTKLRQSAGIVSVTSGYGLPGDQFAGDGVKIDGKEYASNVFIGDEHYVKTLGLRIVAGRDFSRQMQTDVKEAFLINETAVREFGFGTPEKALGRQISWEEWAPADTLQPVKKGKVIGVVQDFHYKSLHEKITACAIQLYPQETYTVAAKLKTADISTTIGSISNLWNEFSPGYPLEYKFMDDSYGKMYQHEEKLSKLLWIFAAMAIFVGCMGLFGLAAFSVEQRKKEIGIRKVLGANPLRIAVMISKRFLVLVAVASVLAFPVGWWAMHRWLNDFTYRISIDWWVFLAATAIALTISLFTIGSQAVKAAISNPVKSLKTE